MAVTTLHPLHPLLKARTRFAEAVAALQEAEAAGLGPRELLEEAGEGGDNALFIVDRVLAALRPPGQDTRPRPEPY
jgi:hypothetical protein